MNEFDAYLSDAGAQAAPTPVQQNMREFNTRMSGNAENEFTNYLKEQTGMTPEKKARMQVKLDATNKRTAQLQAEADQATSPGAYATAGVRGASAALTDVANTATFGGYKKVRNKILEQVSPETLATVTGAENELHAPIKNNPLMRAAQIGTNALSTGVGYATGLGGLAGKAGAALTRGLAPKVAPVVADIAGGGLGGGLTSGAESTIAGDDPLTALRHAGTGALIGGAGGGLLGTAGRAIAGAPKRAVESEMAGLTEGVGYKSKITKFLPKEESIRAELTPPKGSMPPQEEAEALAIRRAIKDNPREAMPAVEKKLSKVAQEDLEPFYARMEHAGVDKVDVNRVNANLAVVRDSFTKHAEHAQRAAVQQLMDGLEADAAGTGTVSARTLREEATAFQSQGFANVPMLGQVQLSKQAKQGMGGALRESIAEHLDDLAPNGGPGDAFRNANKRVAAWYGIKDLMEEKVKRLRTDSPTAADMIKGGLSFAKNGPASLLKYAIPSLGPGAESFDRNILSPMSQNPMARGLGQGAQQMTPVAASSQYDMLQRAREEKLRKDREAAGMLYQE